VTATRRAAFLDRDGTLIHCHLSDGIPVPTHGVVEFVDGAQEACGRLRELGYALVMVTNQPDVARGSVDRRTVEDANQHIAEHLGLDMTLACMHDDLDRCECRKPRPGMLLRAASALNLCLDQSSVMIGDRWRDVDAGNAAGVATVLIARGYGELSMSAPDHIAPDLLHAIEWIGNHLVRSTT
jgi:D-glycero-D-manno-heptose 1,7-bisphosphate phosphatase